jgi:hypothetical protein
MLPASLPAPAASSDPAPAPATSNAESPAPAASSESAPRELLSTQPPEDLPVPERDIDRRPPPETRYWMMGLGVGSAAVWYAAALGIGELWTDAPGHRDLRIPVAGPFMDIGKTGCPSSNPDCSTFQLVVRTILVSLDALGQTGSLAVAVEGALMSTEPSGESPRSLVPRASLRPTAIPTAWFDPTTGGGVGVMGQF